MLGGRPVAGEEVVCDGRGLARLRLRVPVGLRRHRPGPGATAAGWEGITVPAETYMAVRVGDEYTLAGNPKRSTFWYAGGVGDQEMTEAVSGFKRKGEVAVVTVVAVEPSGTYPLQTVAVSTDGLTRLEYVGEKFDPPVPLLKLPARVGARWAVKTEFLATAWAGTRTVQGEEEVRVPAGTFTAVKVEWDNIVDGRPRGKTTSWYAPGIGLVKADFGTSTKVLKKFTPGKD